MENHDRLVVFAAIVCWAAAPSVSARAEDGNDPNKVVVTVVDKRGNTLAGVQVIESETEERYTTDADGQFVCKPSDRMRYLYAVDRPRKLAEAERLEPGCVRLRMELAPAKVVSGRVTDPNGRPLAGVQVAALPMTSSYVLTRADGEYDVGWLTSWEPHSGLCLMARHVERNLAAIVDISRQAASVDIQLAPALSLSGTVTTTDGAPLPGATVSLVLRKWRWGCGTPVNRVTVDATGRFTIPVLPQLQDYELHARAPGYATEELITGVISVVKGCEEVGPIVLTKRVSEDAAGETGRLHIRIVDKNLRPVDASVAQIWKKTSEGGAHAEDVLLISSSVPGLYEIDQLPQGVHHALSIDVEGYAPFRVSDVEVRKEPSEPIVCELSRGGSIEGIVTDEAGHPVMGLPVVINSTLCRRDVVTDPNGRFSTNHLPDTRYSVMVEPGPESPYATTILRGGASCGDQDLRIVVNRKAGVRAPASLLGTSLWELPKTALPLDRSNCGGKAVLLCLFDMNQRPSRRCLQQLAEQAKDLAARGVQTLAVQAAPVDSKELDEWITQQNLSFPVGRIYDDIEDLKSAWGVWSLPWLILTDKDHVVRAEGFQLGELDGILGQTSGVQK